MSDRPSTAVTDSIELMERWRHSQDERAFAALVRSHVGWMRGTALRMLQDARTQNRTDNPKKDADGPRMARIKLITTDL